MRVCDTTFQVWEVVKNNPNHESREMADHPKVYSVQCLSLNLACGDSRVEMLILLTSR